MERVDFFSWERYSVVWFIFTVNFLRNTIRNNLSKLVLSNSRSLKSGQTARSTNLSKHSTLFGPKPRCWNKTNILVDLQLSRCMMQTSRTTSFDWVLKVFHVKKSELTECKTGFPFPPGTIMKILRKIIQELFGHVGLLILLSQIALCWRD